MNGSMQLYMKQPITGTVVTLSTGQGMTANTRYVCAFACSPTNVKMYMPLSGQWSSTTYTAYDATWGSPQTFHLGFQWGGFGFLLHEVQIYPDEFHDNDQTVEQCARWMASRATHRPHPSV